MMKKNMDVNVKKNFVDVSSFFLFEATGDSEAAGCFDPGLDTVSRSYGDDYEEEYDAESCCSDVSDYCMVSKSYGGCEVLGRGYGEDEEEDENGEVVEQGQERGRFHDSQRWRGDVKHTPNVSVDDDSEQIMKEREKSRLFWETCLASGV